MLLRKTHKQAQKALKKGLKVSFEFNHKTLDILMLIIRTSKTGKLVNSVAVLPNGQTDEKLAKAIKKLVKQVTKLL